MQRTLVIGYGNVERTDDGVAFYVINALRRRLGQPPLAHDDTGFCELGGEPDSVFLRQLLPEWMETAAEYEQLVFVDAHVEKTTAALSCVRVLPAFATSPFTHHMPPAMFLALIDSLYGREPAGYLLSIRGIEFGFSRGLSPAASLQVEPAAELILRLMAAGDEASKTEARAF